MLRALFLMLMLIMFVCSIIASAQTVPSSANHNFTNTHNAEDVIKVNTALVNLPVVVSDPSGRYIPNLKAKDFLVYENGVKQEIDQFATVAMPFHVVLLIDASGSVEDNFINIRNAAKEFVNNIRKEDKVMIVSFARHIIHNIEFTNDKDKLNKAIDTIFIGGGTPFIDAVHHVSRNILKNIPGRKAVVMLTDGHDTTSHRTKESAARELEETGALVYVVSYLSEWMSQFPNPRGRAIDQNNPDPRFNRGNDKQYPDKVITPKGNSNGNGNGGFNSPRTPDRNNTPKLPSGSGKGGTRFISSNQPNSPFINVGYQTLKNRYTPTLDYIVQQTDAIQYRAESLESLKEPMKLVAEQLRYVYSLSYYSNNPVDQGGFRKVEVKVINKEDTKLQYKRGYNTTAVKPTAAY